MPSSLNYRYFGGEGKRPLVLLHGLLGSSRNWQTAGAELARDYEVFAVDLRNHGNSPHAPTMSYDEMVADLRAWVDRQGLRRFTLVGHSLGGKVAMRFACRHGLILDSLVVVDISPKAYRPVYGADLSAMDSLELNALTTRQEAESALAVHVPDRAHRRFLLTNLARDPDRGFRWGVNLPVIMESQMILAGNSLDPMDRFLGPVLFVRGSRSNYIKDTDRDRLARYFPAYIVSTVRDAGHNLHVENRSAFVESLRYFREHHLAAAGSGS